MNLLRLTEKVEISLKTKFSYLIGEKFGAYGYLDFYKWVDKTEYCRHFRAFKEKDFKKRIDRSLGNSKNELLKTYKQSHNKIPIWLVTDILTFGEILDLYKLLYKKYQNKIAKEHNLSGIIYLSWLENINLIRNLSAHNSNIVDIKFSTKPKILDEFKNKLYFVNGKISDRIAVSILILEYLAFVINLKYPDGAIRKSLKKLCRNKTDEEARKLGFKDFEIIKNLKI
ncbi:Abi family protein [Leptotrichia hofstadii]|uniref:Abi family protein n=1 Tax=Leptotrichia hofstadii TaxID=157688 RepID=UPI0009E2ECFD|nr:Abi family protein [Leptotrichia hofstadii]